MDFTDTGVVIDDVNTSMWQYIREHYIRQIVLMVVLFMAWEGLIAVFLAPAALADHASSNSGKGVVELMILPLILAAAWLARLRKKFEDAFLQGFAAANGYTYDHLGTVDETYGTMFRVGSGVQVSDVVSGTYQGHQMRLFLCDLTVGTGRNSTTYSNTVLEIDMQGQLPNMLLTSKDVGRAAHRHPDAVGSLLAGGFGVKNTVNLEGDFNQYFNLYAPEINELEALQVFAPDVMALVEDESKSFDIEFVGSRMYIYATHYISNQLDLKHLYAMAKLLVDKVAPIAARLEGDSALVAAPVNLTQQRGNPRAAMLTIVLGLLVGGVLIGFGLWLTAATSEPPVVTGTVKPAGNPVYDAAVAQASQDDLSSTDAVNNGAKIVADGQRALAAATTSLDRAGAEYWIGVGYFWQKQYQPALDEAKLSMADDPTGTVPMLLAGDLEVDLHQYQAAVDTANRVIAMDATEAGAYRLRAFAYANQGRKTAALADADKAISLDLSSTNRSFVKDDQTNRALIVNTPAGYLNFRAP